MLVARGDVVWLAWKAFDGDTMHIKLRRSDDRGEHWSAPREITADTKRPDWTWYATGPGAGIRIEHGASRGRLRFASHRDFQRALERALRRARVPMAYSAGFHPHPKVSYANAAPTGVASEAEYVEIARRRIAADAPLFAGGEA